MHRKNSELTAKIFRDIFAIVKAAKIGNFSDDGNSRKIAVSAERTDLEFWQVTAYLNAASKLKR